MNSTPNEPVTRSRTILTTLKGLGFTLMVLAALWVGLRYVLSPMIFSNASTEPAVTAGDYETRIKELEDKITALEEAKPAESIDVSQLEERVKMLEERPETTAVSAAIAPEALDLVKSEIEKLRYENHTTLKTIIQANQLQEAIRSGKPFASELSTLETLRPDFKEIFAPLEASSATGIATLDQLRIQFKQTIHPALTEKGERSLVQNLRTLVKIRKIGEEQKGTDDEAILARAEAKLTAGDIAAALQETENLSPAPARNFASWQDRAKANLAAQVALEKLKAAVAAGEKE